MTTASILVLAAVCLSVHALAPRECRNHDCPSFQVIHTTNDYQLKALQPAVWVSTSSAVRRNEWMQTKRRLFYQLFGYIQGQNVGGVSIPMTAPVLTEIFGPTNSLKMYFLLPAAFQQNPPAPLPGSPVTLENWGTKEFYIRPFGGYANSTAIVQQITQLKAAINNVDMYDSASFMVAGYDRPSTRFNRYNEIWLAKTPAQ